jgi:hypothetical protein
LIFGPAVLDRDVFTFDEARFFQAQAQSTQAVLGNIGR